MSMYKPPPSWLGFLATIALSIVLIAVVDAKGLPLIGMIVLIIPFLCYLGGRDDGRRQQAQACGCLYCKKGIEDEHHEQTVNQPRAGVRLDHRIHVPISDSQGRVRVSVPCAVHVRTRPSHRANAGRAR